jgi:hypothetical protein
MPNINIEVDKELLAEINYSAALAGKTQKEWVVQELRTSVQVRVALGKAGNGDSSAAEVPSMQETGEAQVQVNESSGEQEVLDENLCPEDGDPLVWNKVLKRWVCECGYQGKVQR